MNIEKEVTRRLSDKITLIVTAAITLVGMCVIAGWHLHIRALIQILPGAIPMQYELSSFLQEEERLDAVRRETVNESWQRFNWLLVAGASADIMLALMLAFLFSRGISSRLLTLTKNAQALAAGKELARTMTGNDEIAQLDQVFHRMAEALDDAARKERAVVENALDVICAIDEEGKFARVSPASLKVWGYRPEELIGRPYIEMVMPEDVPKTNEAAAAIMSGDETTGFENRYRRIH